MFFGPPPAQIPGLFDGLSTIGRFAVPPSSHDFTGFYTVGKVTETQQPLAIGLITKTTDYVWAAAVYSHIETLTPIVEPGAYRNGCYLGIRTSPKDLCRGFYYYAVNPFWTTRSRKSQECVYQFFHIGTSLLITTLGYRSEPFEFSSLHLLGEAISSRRQIGILLVALGVFFVGGSAARVEEKLLSWCSPWLAPLRARSSSSMPCPTSP
jgi:hypothetical protein